MRSWNTQKDNLGVGDSIGTADHEAQVAALQTFGQELVESVLDDGHLTPIEPRHLVGVGIGAYDIVAEMSKAHTCCQPDVPRPNDCEPGHRSSRSGIVRTVSQDTTASEDREPTANPSTRWWSLHGETRSNRRAAVIVVLLLLGVYWTTMGGHTVSVDGEMYLAGTRSLVRHTTVIYRPAEIDGCKS